MDVLRKQIRRARRRLLLQAFATRLAWCWFATLALAAIAIGAGKFFPIGDAQVWALAWLGGALAVGLLAAAGWTWLARGTALEAAAEIDRRFGLKERVSSSLALGPAELESDMGRALVLDAASRVERIDVSGRFGVRLDRWALLPLAPAAVALLLALFVDGPAQRAAVAASEEHAQIKKSTQTLVKRLDEKRKQAEEAGLKDADALLARLEQGTKDLAEKTQADRKSTLVALNDLVKDAEKRREQLAGNSDLKQQLNQLKNLQAGPAQQMAAALKNGDMKKAIQELDKLKAALDGDKLSAEQKKELAAQLKQMHEALEKTAQAHKQAEDELKKQVESERKSGNVAAADKLQQQLDKLAAKSPQMNKLSQLAQQLKKAQQSVDKGDAKQAAEALGQMKDELAGMAKELDEMGMLDEAIEQFAEAKSAMSCKECEGEGCEACQGEGNKPSDMWASRDWAKGGGTGAGKRDKQAGDAGFFDSQVQQKVGKGAMVLKGTADGPNKKGLVQEAIKSEFAGADQQSAEVLSGQKLPRDYRNHAKGYFEALREGKQ